MKAAFVFFGILALASAMNLHFPSNHGQKVYRHPGKYAGNYIIKFKKDVTPAKMQSYGALSMFSENEEQNIKVLKNLKMVTVKGVSESNIELLARMDPDIEYIEEDSEAHVFTSSECSAQEDAVWGLDRLDGEMDGTFVSGSFEQQNHEVFVYILDTGILAHHADFTGRAIYGENFIDAEDDEDLNGHGTHCAGTIGSATYGVSKNVTLVGVKVLSARGGGSFAGVVAGIEWCVEDIIARGNPRAVLSMSLGANTIHQATIDAVEEAVSKNISVVVAAGNDNRDCYRTTPAAAPNVITVGATDSSDKKAWFSNYGECVDIQAPGVGIKSTYIGGTDAATSLSGTSMACPHVAGVVANILRTSEERPTPAEIMDIILSSAVEMERADTIPSGTTTLLLQDVKCTA